MPIILSKKAGGGGGDPSGPAGGSLTGTYPNPTIANTAVDTAQLALDSVDSTIIDGADASAIRTLLGVLPGAELFDSTLGGSAASIDTGAGGFSTAHKHLLVLGQFRGDSATILLNLGIDFNNDTGNNYDDQRTFGRNATATVQDQQAATGNLVDMVGANAAAGVASSLLMLIPNYSNTTFEKSGLVLSGFADEAAAGGSIQMTSTHWRNTAAITRIQVFPAAGNFVTGSRLTVYGIG